MNSTFCALKKVHRSKQTFFGQMSIEKQPAIGSEHFTVGLFAMGVHYVLIFGVMFENFKVHNRRQN